MIIDDPPDDTSGRGTPVTGARPTTTAMLRHACPTIHAPIAAAVIWTNGSVVALDDAVDRHRDHREGDEDEDGPHEPELLAEDRKDEVIVSLRQVQTTSRATGRGRAPRCRPTRAPTCRG